MGVFQVFLGFLTYLLAARGCLLWLPRRWRIPVFALLNFVAGWLLLYPANVQGVPYKIGFYGIYGALVAFQFWVLDRFVDRPGAGPWLAFSTPLAALFCIKYLPAFGPFWHLVGRTPFSLIGGHFIGISYLAFRSSALVFEVRDGLVRKPRFWEYFAFCFFLPTMSVGPISSYQRFQRGFEPANRAELPLARCAMRVIVGLVKFLVLAHICGQLAYEDLLLDGHPHRAVELVVAAAFFYLYLYCNFSGFCDIAIGISGWLGFPIDENFNDPFLARNLQDFWNRWHITLSRWMRDFVFNPLTKWQINRWGAAWSNGAKTVSMLVVFLLVGVWHGVGWNYAAFGLANGLGVVAVYYYGLGLRRWFGKEGYRAYQQNPWVRRLAMVVTFAYVSACLFLFANDFATARKIFAAIQ